MRTSPLVPFLTATITVELVVTPSLNPDAKSGISTNPVVIELAAIAIRFWNSTFPDQPMIYP
jgi:hypothetical protein